MKNLLLPLLFIVPFTSFSQQDMDIITDRPDDTESASLVSKGFLQVESGFYYEELNEGDNFEKTWALNTTLLRFGLLDNLEMRLGFDIVDKSGNLDGFSFETGTGFKPLLLGTKIGIAKEKGLLPEMALMGHLYLPFTAKEDYRPSGTGVDFRFAFGHQLENSSISYNVGAKWVEDNSNATFTYSLAYGYDLASMIGVFIEVYGDLPEHNRTSHYWDGGLTYLISQNFQADAFVGSGINNEQTIIYGAGISFRLPN